MKLAIFYLLAFAHSSAYSNVAVVTRIITPFSSSLLDIRYCSFSSLISTDSGGAVYVNETGIAVKIYSSIFQNCSATYFGGSIYINTNNASASSCCFYLCYCGITANGHGMAICSACSSTLTYKLLSAFQCPSISISIADNTVFRAYSSMNASNLNSSFCYVRFSGSYMINKDSRSSSVLFVGSYSHISANAAGFYYNDQNDNFQFANCVNISNNSGAMFLWMNDNIILRNYTFIDCCYGRLAYSYTGNSTIQFIGCSTNLQYNATASVATVAGYLSYTSTGLLPMSISQLGTFVCSGKATPYVYTGSFSISMGLYTIGSMISTFFIIFNLAE